MIDVHAAKLTAKTGGRQGSAQPRRSGRFQQFPINHDARCPNQIFRHHGASYHRILWFVQNISVEKVAAKQTFHSLDGLRGVASLCVVMLHYGLYIRPLAIRSGYLAVDLFFEISGFVLCYAYNDRLKTKINPIQFLKLRFIRLYPLYILGTLIAIVTPVAGLLLHMSHVWTWRSLTLSTVPALLILPGIGQDSKWGLLYPLNFPAWSLLFELIANVVYAVLLWNQARKTARILVIAAGLGCVAAACLYGNIDSGPSWSGLWVSLARVGFSFGIGVWIVEMYRGGRLPNPKIPCVFVMALVALLLILSPPLWARALYDLACVGMIFPICIMLCVVNEPRIGIRTLSVLGMISYPLYTIHLPSSYVLSRFCDRLLRTDATFHAPWIGVGMIASLSLISFVLARYYDGWARGFLTNRLFPGRCR